MNKKIEDNGFVSVLCFVIHVTIILLDFYAFVFLFLVFHFL